MFVQITDLTGLLAVDVINSQSETELFNQICPQIEKKYLVHLLGYNLYEAFKVGIAETVVAQKWKDLRDGKTFQANDIDLKWAGLKNMLKYFVYYEFLVAKNIQDSSIGLQNMQAETGERTNFNQVQIDAFNEGVNLYGSDIIEYCSPLQNRVSFNIHRWIYTSPLYSVQQKEIQESTPSAFNFLYQTEKETPGTYPNWRFNPLEKINI